MEQESHHSGGDAQSDAQRRNLAQHLLQGKAGTDEHQTIAHIAHAEGEEEHEEDGDEHRRVEFVIFGSAVHVGQQLKHRNELVVFQLDGWVVVDFGFIFDIKDLLLVEHVTQGGLVHRGCKALKDRNVVLSGFLACGISQMQVKFRQGLVQLGLQHGFMPFQLSQAMFFLFHL